MGWLNGDAVLRMTVLGQVLFSGDKISQIERLNSFKYYKYA